MTLTLASRPPRRPHWLSESDHGPGPPAAGNTAQAAAGHRATSSRRVLWWSTPAPATT